MATLAERLFNEYNQFGTPNEQAYRYRICPVCEHRHENPGEEPHIEGPVGEDEL